MTHATAHRFSRAPSAGFTLVELIVALGLFVLVVSISTTIFLQASRSQKLVAERVAALDTVSFVLEQMAREIRTGSRFAFDTSGSYACSQPAVSCWSGIRFINYRGAAVSYRLGVSSEDTSVGSRYIERSEGDGTPLRLTPRNVRIERFDILEYRDGRYPRALPRFTISLTATGPFTEPLELQTTVSPRIFYYQWINTPVLP